MIYFPLESYWNSFFFYNKFKSLCVHTLKHPQTSVTIMLNTRTGLHNTTQKHVGAEDGARGIHRSICSLIWKWLTFLFRWCWLTVGVSSRRGWGSGRVSVCNKYWTEHLNRVNFAQSMFICCLFWVQDLVIHGNRSHSVFPCGCGYSIRTKTCALDRWRTHYRLFLLVNTTQREGFVCNV